METTETKHITKEPIYPAKTVEDIILQIVPDPLCRRANCYGRGYIGIELTKEKTEMVMLCTCARYGETDYVRAMKRVDELTIRLLGLEVQLNDKFETLNIMMINQNGILLNHTLLGRIKIMWKMMRKQKVGKSEKIGA